MGTSGLALFSLPFPSLPFPVWMSGMTRNPPMNPPWIMVGGGGGVVRTKGYSTDLLDPTQVESKKCSQIQWPVPSINAEPVDISLGEE